MDSLSFFINSTLPRLGEQINAEHQHPGAWCGFGTVPSLGQAHAIFTVGLSDKGSEKVIGVGGLLGKAGVEQDPGGKGQTAP